MDLPQPTTVVEFYLLAILEELRGLRQDLKQPQPGEEPEQSAAPAGGSKKLNFSVAKREG